MRAKLLQFNDDLSNEIVSRSIHLGLRIVKILYRHLVNFILGNVPRRNEVNRADFHVP